MTKTSKSERKWGASIDDKPPKKRTKKGQMDTKESEDMYKILIDNSGFSKAMSRDDCIKIIEEMEAKAVKLRRPKPSLMLVKQ